MNSSLPAPRYPYGRTQRYHLQHVHLFAQDIEQTIDFYTRWFDAEVAWDGGYGGARNVFLKIGIGALQLYDQAPRELRRDAVHHLGMQVVGLQDLYDRMQAAGVHLPNPIRHADGGGYFMLQAPDQVLIEAFEPGPDRDERVLTYYGYR